MVVIQDSDKKGRGRPQARCDDDTKCVIVEAANNQFQESGYAAASINAIAADAGVSTKTLYRLFPAKSDLFESVVADRIDKFILALDEGVLFSLGVREGLIRLLTAYGKLALAPETIAINKLVISESDRFPEIAASFYERAIGPTNRIIEAWLERQRGDGRIHVPELADVAGMLRGMMVMEPQRAVMMKQASTLSHSEIEIRAVHCADLLLQSVLSAPKGC